jgi:hypothetical protein
LWTPNYIYHFFLCYFIFLGSKYSSLHFILKYFQSVFFPIGDMSSYEFSECYCTVPQNVSQSCGYYICSTRNSTV